MADPHARYAGMSYRQASEEGERLLKRALATGSWLELPEALVALRGIMGRRRAGYSPETDHADALSPAERAECFGPWAERDSAAAVGTGYHVEVQRLPLADGGGFVATVPELPGCMSDGETVGEARANAADAVGCWLASAWRSKIPPDMRASWATLQRQAWDGTEHRLGR